MGIIEIILTIVAWTVGKWKWLALLPLAFAFGLGLIIGTVNPNASVAEVIWVDVLAVIALIVMCFVKKKDKEPEIKIDKKI